MVIFMVGGGDGGGSAAATGFFYGKRSKKGREFKNCETMLPLHIASRPEEDDRASGGPAFPRVFWKKVFEICKFKLQQLHRDNEQQTQNDK
jgi:hypothetical protein